MATTPARWIDHGRRVFAQTGDAPTRGARPEAAALLGPRRLAARAAYDEPDRGAGRQWPADPAEAKAPVTRSAAKATDRVSD